MITVSVPGKVHLMGEHAIVYGRPALLSAINRRLTVSVEPAPQTRIECSESDTCVQAALAVLIREYKLSILPPLHIIVRSEFPAGYHLGSSAAVAVGVVAAVTYLLKKTWNPIAFNQLAYEVEKTMHGNPSGGDNTTVTFGGFIWYRKELEFLKSIWQVPIKLSSELNHFWLIDTGRPQESTKEMVALAAAGRQRFPARFERCFSENENQTKRIAQAVKDGDADQLVLGMQKGEQTLENMGVVSPVVRPFIRAVEQSGGAAKILGGGGRKRGVGFLLVYHPQTATVTNLGHQFHYPVQSIVLGEEGIRLENK
jgi:mevalonate kinase